MELEDISIASPPKAFTKFVYSSSGSSINISSLDKRKESDISFFAAKDLPEPDEPNISPFGVFNFNLSQIKRFFCKWINPVIYPRWINYFF